MANGHPRWDDGLEGAALVIAESPAPALRVQAGPGTGKTYALMRRVMRLLQSGVAPDRILVATFTRTAARDLATEIANLGVPGAVDIRAGTLHSYCFSALRSGPVLRATGRRPRPVINFEARFMLQDLGTIFGGIRDRQQRLNAFNAAWARMQDDEPGWPVDPIDQRFQAALHSWLTFHAAMLVGELVPVTLRYLRDNPACAERQQFDYVVVDEYQDLNRAEQVLVDLLADHANLTIVGDEDQSIYSFKHAHPEGIRTFDQAHAGTKDQDLMECRRCPTRVVALAAALIRNNASFTGRVLAPRAANPAGIVHIVQWPSLEEEAQGVARYVQRRIAAGEVAPGRVLILAPRRQFGYAVRDALNVIGVPAHSFFNEEALDGNPADLTRSRAQQAYTLLTLLANEDDAVALRCWCGFGSANLSEPAWRRIRDHVANNGGTVRDVLAALAAGTIRIPHTASAVARYLILQAELDRLANLAGQQLVDALFPADEDWAEPFRRIAVAEEPVDPFTPVTLCDAVRSGVTQPELPADVDFVRVMSLHKSKGLTADLVVVLGCVQGAIPSTAREGATVAERDRHLEEQRRLFYVALTRTRGTLVISSVTAVPRTEAWTMGIAVIGRHPTHGVTVASQFLAELGPAQPVAIPGVELP